MAIAIQSNDPSRKVETNLAGSATKLLRGGENLFSLRNK
jgi:hypothetical protein